MKKFLAMLLACVVILGCTTAFAYDGTAPIADHTVSFSAISNNGASRYNEFENMVWWQEVLKKANVNLDMEMIDASSYQDVIKPHMAAGLDLPDLILLNGSFDEFQAYIDAGMLLDLTEYYAWAGRITGGRR